ncbi:MAG TPA: SPOR domain-containing protein [Fodinibius sp.]|nr:SPOR domain-containing protein [Fodinibius sp.]
MKQLILFLTIAFFSMGMLSSCGPSEEEQRQAEQARQDSLEQVRQQQLEQQRKDSLAQARQDSLEAQKEEENQVDVTFDESGSFAVQVEAWRSKGKAQGQVDKWVERGFDNAFVVQHGNEETGDVWFRVRLGRLSSPDDAQSLREQLQEQYDASSWVSTAER